MRFDLVMIYGVISTKSNDNKPAMDRVKNFLLDNNGKYLDIWSGIPDAITGKNNPGTITNMDVSTMCEPVCQAWRQTKEENYLHQIMNISASYEESTKLFYQTGVVGKGNVPRKHYWKIIPSSSNWSHIFLIGLRATLGRLTLELFKISPSIKKRLLQVFVLSDRLMTLPMKSEEDNKDKKKKKNKKQKKTETPMYDEIMERLEIETGANVSNAGRSKSGLNPTNDSAKSATISYLN
ncbi:uncharacterized protein EV154DRAFT_577356 [Mucor mucedo]|uniref:uncharacterized protein n=1 Tax=Mucor mucedo TaxID=29922 RepID=UPI00221F04BA|nr:uncharacterized protein EV154DRAFT_577356 [Mucor mucedo]KAI7875965.1 hypothetical protein EV154DRAFT_577356 [Mucor mucedo]